jgi:diaminopimelate decarboxylase
MVTYRNKELFVENVSFKTLASTYGTPCYIYSKKYLVEQFSDYKNAFKGYPQTIICYSVKANSNLSILKVFKEMGSGFDIVSGGELERVIAIGANPKKVVFSGVAKSNEEVRKAIEFGILFFNVESFDELEVINKIAKKTRHVAEISIRVNPDINPKTHPYISTGLKSSKFGIPIRQSFEIYREAKKMKNIKLIGIDAHIGSQILDLDPFEDSLERLENLYFKLKDENINIDFIDIGGGLGIKYKDEDRPPPKKKFAQTIIKRMKRINCKLLLEPGRSLVGNSGYLLTAVVYKKNNYKTNFLIIDAGMNDLLRPALYGSYHKISKVIRSRKDEKIYDVVGPICETGDVIAKNLPMNDMKLGDILVIHSAGAYGATMSSNYNTRPKIPEILVSGNKTFLIRKKETISQILENEVII